MGNYACRGRGYEEDCTPRDGESCAELCYERLAARCPGRPEALAPAAKRADAFTRYHRARLSWLGPDHPLYLDEFLDGDRPDGIRYAPFRSA